MKINSTNLDSIYKAYGRSNYSNNVKNTSNVNTDKIVLSDSAKYLSKLSEEKEEVNIEKINEIKEKLKSGTYNLNSKDIAKKMMDVMKEIK